MRFPGLCHSIFQFLFSCFLHCISLGRCAISISPYLRASFCSMGSVFFAIALLCTYVRCPRIDFILACVGILSISIPYFHFLLLGRFFRNTSPCFQGSRRVSRFDHSHLVGFPLFRPICLRWYRVVYFGQVCFKCAFKLPRFWNVKGQYGHFGPSLATSLCVIPICINRYFTIFLFSALCAFPCFRISRYKSYSVCF